MAEIKLKIASVVIGSGEGGGSGVAPYYTDLPDKPVSLVSVRLVNCQNKKVSTALLYNVPNYTPLHYNVSNISTGFTIDEIIYSDVQPTLSSTVKYAQWYDMTNKLMKLWNGTSWVNLDGTALS